MQHVLHATIYELREMIQIQKYVNITKLFWITRLISLAMDLAIAAIAWSRNYSIEKIRKID